MKKRNVLISSIITIALCLSVIAGSTFALFTSEDKVNVAINAGNVDITANLIKDSLKTWSLYEDEEDARTDGSFVNGGMAAITDEANVQIDLMTPGDVVKFVIDVDNNSDVHVNYRVRMAATAIEKLDANGNPTGEYYTDLAEALVVTAYIDHDADPSTDDKAFVIGGSTASRATLWQFVEQNKEIGDITVVIEFPNTDDSISPDNKDNKFQGARTNITYTLEAVQSNGMVYDYNVVSTEEYQDTLSSKEGGIITSNGATVALEDIGILNNADYVLQDIVADGSNLSLADGEMAPLVYFGYPGSLTLGNKAHVIAGATGSGNYGIANISTPNATLVIENNASVTATGADNACIYVDADNMSITLYDENSLKAESGAYAILMTYGGNLNVYVPNEEVYKHYTQLDANGYHMYLAIGNGVTAQITWYVGDSTTPYNVMTDIVDVKNR